MLKRVAHGIPSTPSCLIYPTVKLSFTLNTFIFVDRTMTIASEDERSDNDRSDCETGLFIPQLLCNFYWGVMEWNILQVFPIYSKLKLIFFKIVPGTGNPPASATLSGGASNVNRELSSQYLFKFDSTLFKFNYFNFIPTFN